ncbi:bifunctional hydroxymethylpyrimidine kinase/phosphomethylpyrimidine kinase [Aeromonas veronii]|uniref:Thiamine-phosphate synthase n=1 Tax=Aeromonas veronii TaxID=654 RepID=A0A6S5C2B5_AERVE|nr:MULTISPECIES: thiamine phosphate synthase [Aeromonas]BBR38092.1 bifunctional hydroxymethylpyrimidine kinase/phosphomethylpyrimidine kinase [Aeromonas veronii]
MSSASGAVSPAELLVATEARPVVWTIAGSDSGGGAGIQADLHTLHDLGVHGCSVISAITAQNSVAVKMVDPVLMQTFTAQIDALGVDLPPAAIKIGLLPTRLHVEVLARRLAAIEAPFVVYDPVAIASTGTPMAEPNMLEAVREQLLPRLSLITPNGPELEALTGLPATSPELVRLAARRLRELGARAVLVKGGHLAWGGDLCLDYYQDESREFWLAAPRLDTRHGHGTGCCYASAIAAVVALDYPVEDAITLARAYLQQGLAAAQGVGAGPGPIAHLGWPADLAHFPRAVLAGSTLDRRFGLFSVEGMEASCVRLPDGPFAATEQHLGLYPVVDSVKWLRRLLGQGVKTIQLRIKNLPAAQVAPAIAEAVALGRRHGARLFINDYWQQAIEAGAWGVHLGQEDMETADLAAIQAAGLRLGISTHGYFELMRARELAPSYMALGHIFPTNTKAMPSRPQGLVRLHRYRALMAQWPTVAIGGISEERVAAVKASGVGSIALVSAITASDDWQGATERLLEAVGAGDEPRSATDIREVEHAL